MPLEQEQLIESAKLAGVIMEDLKHSPELPWSNDGDNIFDAQNLRIAQSVRKREAKFVANTINAMGKLAKAHLQLLLLLKDLDLDDGLGQEHLYELVKDIKNMELYQVEPPMPSVFVRPRVVL